MSFHYPQSSQAGGAAVPGQGQGGGYRPPLPPRPQWHGRSPPPLPPRPASFESSSAGQSTASRGAGQYSASQQRAFSPPHSASVPPSGGQPSYLGQETPLNVSDLFPGGIVPPPPPKAVSPTGDVTHSSRSTPYGPGLTPREDRSQRHGTDNMSHVSNHQESPMSQDDANSTIPVPVSPVYEQPSRSTPYGPGLNSSSQQKRESPAVETETDGLGYMYNYGNRPSVSPVPQHTTKDSNEDDIQDINEGLRSIRVSQPYAKVFSKGTESMATQKGRPPAPTVESAPNSPSSSPAPSSSTNNAQVSPCQDCDCGSRTQAVNTAQTHAQPPMPSATPQDGYSSPSSATGQDAPSQSHQHQNHVYNQPLYEHQPRQQTGPAAWERTQQLPSSPVLTECISTFTAFAATWYIHPQAPAFNICAFCYKTNLRNTRFASEFQGVYRTDGQLRACRFKTTRIKEDLLKTALATGSLGPLVRFLNARANIKDCAGRGGAKGTAGITWYRARNNAIPPMVVCQACYEDDVLTYRRFGECHFEPSSLVQRADDVWSCDFASPYILREYNLRAPANDWPTFVKEATSRLSITQQCPGTKTVYPNGKAWFTPKNGSFHGFLICIACFCDYFCSTPDEENWTQFQGDLVKSFGVSVRCCLAPFNVRCLAGRTTEDTGDFDKFWSVLNIILRQPQCEAKGMTGATWFTLNSDPANFDVCKACYMTIIEPMGIGKHFKQKPTYPAGTRVMCDFNPTIPRFSTCMSKALEMVYRQDPQPLDEFVRTYASMPICQRDKRVPNRRWYGWNECMICPECYHEFARNTALAPLMPHQSAFESAPIMCELYSPRMRKIYSASCATHPPDATLFLQESLRRRSIWIETMPRVRELLQNEEMKMLKWQDTARNGMFYTSIGNTYANTVGPGLYTYGHAGVGYGFENSLQVQGAEYSKQAAAMQSGMGGVPLLEAERLERRWRAVE
ncbi:hypothetical protein GGR57DRAFT_37668 [Xylariaceae sp. FL1272]|nr:hypothetical protein GGR57DRAFT_37668 [Xylariaceae sp. FL1272]